MKTGIETSLSIIIAAATIGVAVAVAAQRSGTSSRIEGDTIILGAVLSFEGKYETSGRHTYNGYEFAVDRINSKGGVTVKGRSYRLKIRYEDDESDSKKATETAERLVKQDGIRFMLGPYSSGMTKAVAEVTERYKVPLVAAEGASPSLFDRGNRYIFGLLSTADQYFGSLIDLAAMKARQSGTDPRDLTLAVAVENDRFSLYVRKAVIADAKICGINVVIDDKLPGFITTMKETLKKVKILKPDIFVVSGHSRGADTVARELTETGIRVPVLAITHCEAARINQKYPQAVEGAYCPAQWAPSLPYRDNLFGTAEDFAEDIQKANPEERYEDVPYQAASAAAALMVWKDAFERADTFDTEKLRDALASTDLKTFYGRIKFADNGAIVSKPMVLRQISSGTFSVVSTDFESCTP